MKNIWRELFRAAKIIDNWSNKQRKIYLKELKKREKQKGKTLYRNIIKLMLTDSKRRKHFIKLSRTFYKNNYSLLSKNLLKPFH
jgi:hypothetical protein